MPGVPAASHGGVAGAEVDEGRQAALAGGVGYPSDHPAAPRGKRCVSRRWAGAAVFANASRNPKEEEETREEVQRKVQVEMGLELE